MTDGPRPPALRFSKAHAYGNDFLYLRRADVGSAIALDALARELCDRHTGIGADGLILYEATPDGASMRLLNADGSRSEVSGNGVRGLPRCCCATTSGPTCRSRSTARRA